MPFLRMNVDSPIEYISGGQFFSETPWIHTKRCIDSFEIIIGVNNTLYMEQDDIKYEIKPGNVLLLLPGHVHQGYDWCEEGLSFYWFHFHSHSYELIDAETMKEEVSAFRNDPDSGQGIADIYIPLYCTPPGIHRVHILFHQLLHVANANFHALHSGHYMLTSLLIELSEQTITDVFLPHIRVSDELNLSKIIEWTRIHAMGDISVTSVAEKFSYNKDYLSRFFKQKTGMNLQEYIHQLKISKSKDLLSRTTQKIKEISHHIGIEDEKYFMKLFKKYEKITPTEFRQAFVKTHMNNQ